MASEIMPAFCKVAVIDNPASGPLSSRHKATLRDVLAALRQAGVANEHLLIDGPGSGGVLAREAICRGCDAILVCGGDGTIHEVLQVLVGTSVSLGVVPLGTANALASDLGVSKSPADAVRALLASRPIQIPVGRIFYRDAHGAEQSRYFTVAAGVGADALLMAHLDPMLKRRLGYLLYLLEAARIWAFHRFPLFQAKFTCNRNGTSRLEDVSQLLAVRVRSFGGVLGRLAPGATLHSRALSVVAFKTRSRFSYLRFLAAVMCGQQTFSRQVELIAADSVECDPRNGSHTNVYAEADGEVLGQLPVRIEIASETLSLLIPPDAEP